MPSNHAMLRAALRYAAMGLPVVPIDSLGKAPLVRKGVHAASTDPGQIKRWWGRWPKATLALACGERAGFDALDVDKQHGGIESLKAILGAHESLPRTAWQRTPSGGFHLLFHHQPGLKNWSGGQGLAPPGLDCRTTGAMIRTGSLLGYRWERFVDPDELPPWPDCLAAFFRPIGSPARTGERVPVLPSSSWFDRAGRYLASALNGLAEDIASAPPGCQQSTLNGAAFRAGRLLAAVPDQPVDEVTEMLTSAGMRMANQPGRQPWHHVDVDRVVRRGIANGMRDGPAALPAMHESVS